MIEVVVALAVLVLVIMPLVGGTITSIRNTNFAKNRALATKYTQEVLEKVRLHRDENSWQVFINDCNNDRISLDFPPNPFTLSSLDCYRPWIGSPICDASDSSCEVKVTISWTDGQGTHKSELKTRLTNWK